MMTIMSLNANTASIQGYQHVSTMGIYTTSCDLLNQLFQLVNIHITHMHTVAHSH